METSSSSVASTSSSYRDEQIAHVTGLKGSTSTHIMCILLQLSLITFLLKTLCHRLSTRHTGFFSFWIQLFCLSTFPVLMVTSPFADQAFWVFWILCGVCYLTWVLLGRFCGELEPDGDRIDLLDSTQGNGNSVNTTNSSTFVTYFRACSTLSTVVCILAVDFKVFPRELAKTEWFGVSLMDIGTGIFIFSSALTSSYARSGMVVPKANHPAPSTPSSPTVSPASQVLPTNSSTPSSSLSSTPSSKSSYPPQLLSSPALYYITSLSRKSITRIIILLLGVGRMITLKALEYQEHVSEYGVHWNFFVTLFLVWNLADLFRALVPHDSVRVGLSILLMSIYQYFLVVGSNKDDGLNDFSTYIFSAERNDFISANKEGFCSLGGYLPLYVITESFSKRNIFNRCDGVIERERKRSKAMLGLIFISALMYVITSQYIQVASRRLMNLSFVSLLFLCCCTCLYTFYLVDVKVPPEGIYRLHFYSLLGDNQLVVFLLANVMTGIVNITMQTIYMNDREALTVLIVYMVTLLLASNFICNFLWGYVKDSHFLLRLRTARKQFFSSSK